MGTGKFSTSNISPASSSSSTTLSTETSSTQNSSTTTQQQEEGYKLRDTRRRLNRRRTTESSESDDQQQMSVGIRGLLSDFSLLNFVGNNTEQFKRQILNLPSHHQQQQAKHTRFLPRSQSQIEPRQRGTTNKPQKRRLKKFNSEVITSGNEYDEDDDSDAKRMCLLEHSA